MNDELIIKYIENEYENEFLDFKLNPYNWNEQSSKSDFLIDVISLSNSSTEKDRYIILGVKIKSNGERIIKGINTNDLVDSAEYQQIVTENIEPTLSVEVKIITNSVGLKFGIIKIFNCNNKPYLLKKKYGNLEPGFIKVRKGSRNSNISRYILDEMYESKNAKTESKFKVSGLIDGKISDTVELGKYDFFPNIGKRKELLINIFNEINDFKIDDVFNRNKLYNGKENFFTLFPPKPAKIEEPIRKNIRSLEKEFKLKISENFFDVGDATYIYDGIKSSNLSISPQYKLEGSQKSKEKYNLIMKLNMIIESTISWLDFLKKIEDIRYIELAITEIGNTSDEEIEISIKVPKTNYISCEDFPRPSNNIVKEINVNFSEQMFKPYYLEDISDFRGMLPSGKSYILPQNYLLDKNNIEIFNEPSNYIDYDVIYNDKFAILSFTIKSLKENETMIFPGKILVKGKVNQLRYSIVSKKSREKISGTINILQ